MRCIVHVLSNTYGTKITNLQFFDYTQFWRKLSSFHNVTDGN